MFMIRALRGGRTEGSDGAAIEHLVLPAPPAVRVLDFHKTSTGCFEKKKKKVQQYIINPNYSTPNYKPMGQDLAINLDAFINKTAVRPGREAAARGSYTGRS